MADKKGTLSSVRSAARLLKQFSNRDRELGVSELARRLDLGKSTVHRLLVTLTSENLLEQNLDNGKYRLGIAMHDLGSAVATRLDLHEAVIPPMERLRNITGETVHTAVLDGREVVYVERLDSPQTLRLFLEVGRRNSAHLTATGKCLMAYLPPDDLDRTLKGWKLEARTSYTITSHAKLRDELGEIRKRGYAENRFESELGVISVAAPIRNLAGAVVASVSVAGPDIRMEENTPQAIQAVQKAAAVASHRLGYRR
ncbi:MAG: IclR family transcriptional regulator [Actinomycetota bacterium]|nr:IclR family transcriptional regulator [Actinomycetota bacterium]